MSRRDRNHRHSALMLIACAFGFVYLLAWQFQGDDIMHSVDTMPPPPTLAKTITDLPLDPSPDPTPTNASTTTQSSSGSQSTSGQISFTSLNALPQSFISLGLASTQGIMMDNKGIIVTSNTNRIDRDGERKTFAGAELQGLGIQADSLTFYNDDRWINILVLMEIVRNDQTRLLQIPYATYRDDKPHINKLITQLTQ